MLLHPNKKNTKKLRDVLQQLYGHLDSSAQAGTQGSHDVGIRSNIQALLLHLLIWFVGFQSVDIPGLGFGQSDYYPYVYYKINIDMVDSKVW